MVKKAFVDKETCIGCTVCTETCPSVFTVKQDEEFDLDYKSTPDDSVDQVPIEQEVQDAIDSCPVQCISWKEKKT